MKCKLITELDIVEPIMTTKTKKEIKGYKLSIKIQFVVSLIWYISFYGAGTSLCIYFCSLKQEKTLTSVAPK